jgi:hypothetical protein
MKGLGAVHFPTCRQAVPMKLDHREAREFIIVRGEMTSYAFLFTPDSKPYIRTVRISASRAGGLTLMQVICILKLSSCGSWFDEAASGPQARSYSIAASRDESYMGYSAKNDLPGDNCSGPHME